MTVTVHRYRIGDELSAWEFGDPAGAETRPAAVTRVIHVPKGSDVCVGKRVRLICLGHYEGGELEVGMTAQLLVRIAEMRTHPGVWLAATIV